MSAYGMHPTFKDYATYAEWRRQWASLFRGQIRRIHEERQALVDNQRVGDHENARRAQRRLREYRVMGHKLMTLLDTAKDRWSRIKMMRRQIDEQNKQFPLKIENCPLVDFHFNKGVIEFDFLPSWILKTKGKTYYVTHVDFDCAGTTRETLDHPSTKGSMRFRRVDIMLNMNGSATVVRRSSNVSEVAR